MLLYVIFIVCFIGQLEDARSQDLFEDIEGESSTEAEPRNNGICNEENCRSGGDDNEDIKEKNKVEEPESEQLEVGYYSEDNFADDEYILTDEGMFDDNLDLEYEEMLYDEYNLEEKENDNFEDPIEEVEPYALEKADDSNDDDIIWTPENIQKNLQEMQKIDEYPKDEECVQRSEKKSKKGMQKHRHSKKAEKLEQRRQTNLRLKDCCMKGKRVGRRANIYKSDNLFLACRNTIRNNMPRIAYHCQWIMQTCCENKALRRYYVHHKKS